MLHRHILLCATLAVTLTAAPVLAGPAQWRAEWPDTDFTRTTIDYAEILSGGPPKDGIPAIDHPAFIAVAKERRLLIQEPVMTYEPPGEAPRAYPIRYLMWHEIVNDVVAARPFVVTYCPLCNSAMIFDARIDGARHTFGVSGKLRNSDMVMYDRETQSWWQQAIGSGIVGVHTGRHLTQLPGWMESWGEYRDRNPDGLVMDEPGWARDYGGNPYVRYDSSRQPFLYTGEHPPHGIASLARVVRVGERAWPFERVRAQGQLTEAGVTLTWTPGQASALDHARIAQGREVGTIRVRDAAGANVPHDVPFAFAFHAFFPDGEWMLGE